MKIEDNRKSEYCILEELEAGKCFEYGKGILMKTDEWNLDAEVRVVDIGSGNVIMLPPTIIVKLIDVKAVIE